MLISSAFDGFFKTTMVALAPYSRDLVCIGGCANALYRHHKAAATTDLAFLGTHDIDIAVRQEVPVRGSRPIAQIMIESGLKEKTFGTDTDAVVKYCPVNAEFAADVEFLCPASGLRGTSKGRSLPISCDVQAGLKAQPLRYLELLLHHPWRVHAGRIEGFSQLRRIVINVPSPTVYIVQKVLIRQERRRPASMAKDCYYIFEISVLFRDALDLLADDFAALSVTFPTKWFKTFEAAAERLFRDKNAEGPVSAMKVYRATADARVSGVRPNEEVVAAAVTKLLARLRVTR